MKKVTNKKIFLSLIIIGLLVVTLVPLVAAVIEPTSTPGEILTAIGDISKDLIKTASRFIIGEVPLELEQEYGVNNAWIVVAAIWALIFITFADVIATFSSFGKVTSWAVAFLVAVIAANTRVIGGGVILVTQWFVWGGTAAVYMALGIAFIAFIGANLGIMFIGKWIMRRKMVIRAAKSEAGGTKVTSAIRELKKVEKELGKP